MNRVKTSGSFRPGAGGGRPKGTPNKLTSTVKEIVLAVFNDLQQDPKYSLDAFAKKYPRDFYNIAAKLIPTDIRADLRVTKTTLEIVRTYTTSTFDLTPITTESN